LGENEVLYAEPACSNISSSVYIFSYMVCPWSLPLSYLPCIHQSNDEREPAWAQRIREFTFTWAIWEYEDHVLYDPG